MTNSQEESKPRVSIRSPEAQFAIGPAIDGVLDDLIQTGADIVSLLEYNRNKRGEIDLTRSQANNMVTVAARTRSREVVTNFIRYQMGRETGKSWRYVSVSNPDRLPF